MSVKAFELVPAIERIKLMSEKARTQIECIEVCGKNLYIGTNDCFVIHYVVQEKTASPTGKVVFTSDKQQHKYLGLRKPIMQLKAASALNRILVLCDSMLTLLNMFHLEPIVSGAKIKGVICFCLNENPGRSNPFSIEVCVALKKKQVQMYTVTEDRMIHTKDINLMEPALTLGLDGMFICAALVTQYCMVNFETGHVQDLFPYQSEHCKGIVKRISKEEFLLGGPSALGMFVTSAGISQRPPLQWSENLVNVGYIHPYIVALSNEFITVHSILDQQQKQTIPFQGGTFLGDFDGRIFVASNKEIYALVPVAWEKQINALLADKRVSEALELAKNANRTGVSKGKFSKIYNRIKQQAGFIEFAQKHFDEAGELFRTSDLDVRELISLYPHLMPSVSNFTRSVPPLHDIADIHQLAKANTTNLTGYKAFLQAFLEEVRLTSEGATFKQDIDNALLKLYAENNSPELIPLIAVETECNLKDSIDILEKYHRYHALALLYKSHDQRDKALQLWIKLLKQDMKDLAFPGLEFVVEYLANLGDHELVWKYVDCVLDKDQEVGVKVFTERPTSEPLSERMRPDTVIDYLYRYPSAVISYLEYLVFQKKLEKEKYHTHLAVLYLDAVLQLMKNKKATKEMLDSARSKLRHMLQMSNLFRIQLILGKAKETEMHAECAILYGKLEEHDKALRILVHKLKDYGAAENYCLVNSQNKDNTYRKRLFHILLSVYLDPSYEKREMLIAPAVALLNSNVAEFDTIKVLQLLPDNWSVGLLSQFLSRSIRKGMNMCRSKRIERMMARGESLWVKECSIKMQKKPVHMTEERLCAVCSRAFSDPAFVRYPTGAITHIHCAKNRQVCPVTGRLYMVKKS